MSSDDLIAKGIRDTSEEKFTKYRPMGKRHNFSIGYKILRGIIIRFPVKRVPSVRSVNIILTTIISVLFALLGLGLFKRILKGETK